MSVLNPDSLAQTIDSISEAWFFGNPIDRDDLAKAVAWICSRQGLPGSYAGMFAPTAGDMSGIRLFTGERVSSGAGVRHQLGEDACRVLNASGSDDALVKSSLARASDSMSAWLDKCESRGYSTAVFCCGTCSAGYWRNLAKGVFQRSGERLEKGLVELKKLRKGEGEWNRFPFFYTSLALTEMDAGLSRPELEYAARRWEKLLPGLEKRRDVFSRRKAAVGRRVLASV